MRERVRSRLRAGATPASGPPGGLRHNSPNEPASPKKKP
jgi:hypothetical protein